MAEHPCNSMPEMANGLLRWRRRSAVTPGRLALPCTPQVYRLTMEIVMSVRTCVACVSLLLRCWRCGAVDLPANMPKRKAGLWNADLRHGRSAQSTKLPGRCHGSGHGRKMNADERPDVQQGGVNVQGSTVVADAVCNIQAPSGAMNITSHSEARFEGDTLSHGHQIKYDPALMGHSEMAVTTGRWVGQCAAGQKLRATW